MSLKHASRKVHKVVLTGQTLSSKSLKCFFQIFLQHTLLHMSVVQLNFTCFLLNYYLLTLQFTNNDKIAV